MGNNINTIFETLTPGTERKEKMYRTIVTESYKEKQNGHVRELYNRQAPKKIVIAVIVAAVCILTTTVALAITFSWHQLLLDYLNPSEMQIQEMNGAVGTPCATITKNGVTVNVLQTITDSYNVFVLYELIVPEWIELTDDIKWSNEDFIVPTSIGGTMYSGEYGSTTLEQSENRRITLLHYSQTREIANGFIRMQFENLCRFIIIYDDNGEYMDLERVPLVEGEWDLAWELNYEDKSSIVIDSDISVSINGSSNRITRIVISPISVLINIEGDDILTVVRPVVTLIDGSQIAFDFKSDTKSFSYSILSGNDLYYRFDNLINTDDVVSVTIGDVTIFVS